MVTPRPPALRMIAAQGAYGILPRRELRMRNPTRADGETEASEEDRVPDRGHHNQGAGKHQVPDRTSRISRRGRPRRRHSRTSCCMRPFEPPPPDEPFPLEPFPPDEFEQP